MTDETKTKQPWTPGQWEVFGGRLIRSVDEGVATPLAETVSPYRRGVGPVLASEEKSANGILMAAAPALAEALAELVDAPGLVWQTPEEKAAKSKAAALLELIGWRGWT